MDLKETYNKIAEEWHNDHKTDDWWVAGTDKFIELMNNRGLVLDVGCGSGVKSKYLINKGLKVVGIDIAEKMVEIAKKEVTGGEFIVMDLLDVDKLPYTFDGIFMQAVLLHIPKKDVKEVLNKLVNKLKNGGFLYIAVKEKRLGGAEEEVKIDNDYGYNYERFFSYFTTEELNRYLENLGFKIVFTQTHTGGRSTNWISIIGKKP